jgi:hypothetical protein
MKEWRIKPDWSDNIPHCSNLDHESGNAWIQDSDRLFIHNNRTRIETSPEKKKWISEGFMGQRKRYARPNL